MNLIIAPSALPTLQAHLRSEVIGPGDERYDRARRVWNGRIDRFPSGIVYCTDASDVRSAIDFARQAEMAVAVRGGGHSMIGLSVCDGGLVIDLSGMKAIDIDPVRRIARAQTGLTMGEFVHGTQEYGLATADGQMLTASADEHPDLFWGVRGGGGNFGVATSFTFQLHPVDTVLAGKISYPFSQTREVLRFYQEFTQNAPDELTAYAALATTSHGIPTISISLCYAGPLAEGERLVAPLRAFGSPLVDLIHPRSYFQAIGSDAGAPNGRHYYEQAFSLGELSESVIDLIADYCTARTSPHSQVLIQHVHGTARQVSPAATAFALRDVPYVMNIVAAWNADEAQEASTHTQWVRDFRAALLPFTLEGVYTNFLGDEGEEGVKAAYGANYARLVALKNRYDPTNAFRFNQNIKPTV